MRRIESANSHLQVVHQDVMSKKTAKESVNAFMNGLGDLLDNALRAAEGNGATPDELQPFRDLTATLQHNKDCFVEAFEAKGLQRDDPEASKHDETPHDPSLMSEQTTPKDPPASPSPVPSNTGPSKPVTGPTNPNTPPKT